MGGGRERRAVRIRAEVGAVDERRVCRRREAWVSGFGGWEAEGDWWGLVVVLG